MTCVFNIEKIEYRKLSELNAIYIDYTALQFKS